MPGSMSPAPAITNITSGICGITRAAEKLNRVPSNITTRIGQLEDDSIFYLQSRGIGAEEARKILTRGFAMEIIEKIKLEPLKRAAESALNQHFSAV